MSIPVYWWRSRNGGYNLGDELTPVLLRHLFGADIERKPLHQARLAGAGSLLGWPWALPGAADNSRKEPLSIVGSGLMEAKDDLGQLDCVKIHSVRGYLSKMLLPPEMVAQSTMGDPGLLVSLLPHRRKAPNHRIGVIPHVGSIGRSHFTERLAGLKDYRIIDFRTTDVDAVLAEMLDCQVIYSQSLHGLVMADALGIPNTWLDFGRLHPGGSFKFYDYFSSVRRPFDLAVGPTDTLTSDLADRNLFEVSDRVVRSLQNDIVEAFADALACAVPA